MADVWIPTQMQFFTGQKRQVEIAGDTIGQIINNLDKAFPGLKNHLAYNDEIMPGLAVIVDGEDTHLGMLQPVKDDSEIHFIPSIAGG
ncbi:MAG: MoaD/ThiS family protein [SAR202 cluster bacterium]|nr:MoaD/ThiS family protein [SAR202 cluster bacterium]|tara:strand:- start:639 stop:902 length:264 start_codon:yes stop_codon:yes gene_type:complete